MSKGDESWADSHSPVESDELAALGRLLSASEGVFSFSIAVCNSPAEVDSLIDTICGRVDGVCRIRIEKGVRDVFGFVSENAGENCRWGVFVTGLERIVPSDGGRSVLQNMNAVRESWKERFSCPVVFWVPEYVATLLSENARDLWSWISPKLDFRVEQGAGDLGARGHAVSAALSSLSFGYDEKLERIAELEDRSREAEKAGDEGLYSHLASWLTEVGLLKSSIGRLDEAEEAFRWVLEVACTQGDEGAKAAALGNLGLIYRRRGELDKAEEVLGKGLKIHEQLGDRGGMAGDHGNLGLIYQTRGELEKAEEMFVRVLEIEKDLGRLWSTANSYGNLGTIFLMRGELEKAEEMYRKSLEIEKKLGRQEGMANVYAALGLVNEKRGDLDRAEEMHVKSLEIEEKLGRQEGMARQYGNLGVILQRSGELKKGEEMYLKSLEIFKKLGQQEGMASEYGNLGLIYRTRGDEVKARAYWEEALGLYKRIGMAHRVKEVEGWIRRLE